MKKIITFAAVALVTAGLSSPAFAGSCPNIMKSIDATLAKMPSMETAKITTLRAKGEAQHKSGDHQGSVKTLEQVMTMISM